MRPFKNFQYSLCFFSLIFINYAKAQYISVDTSLSDQALVNKFIGTQNCIMVSGVSITGSTVGGADPSYGYFTKNGSAFDIDEGIILSTGIARAAEGPNTYRQDNGSSGWGGDLDLANVFGTSLNNYKNATYLEFDFVSKESSAVSFQYMFLSEEYDKFKSLNGCPYSDAFAFLIKPAGSSDPYTNIAKVPNTNDPVSVVNVRGSGGNCPPKNEDYFGSFNLESSTSTSPTNFNGQTKVLTAIANVQVGVKYHIKLVIADEGTVGHDSAVLLKTGSFIGNIDLGPDLTLENTNPLCAGDFHDITTLSGASSYRWFRNGTAILGTDDLQTYRATQDGEYRVDIVLSSGCKLEGNLKIEAAPVAQVSVVPIIVCDGDFDGDFSAKLSTFDSQIIRDYNPAVFDRFYSLTPGGTAINPDSEFVFTSNPQILYLSVGSKTCTPDIYPIQFDFGTKLKIDKSKPIFDVCDNDRSGSESEMLTKYVDGVMTTETGITPTFYSTPEEAQSGGASTVDILQKFDPAVPSKTFYLRIEKAGACPEYAEFTLVYKMPRESLLLQDSTICKGATLNLVVETNFDYYEWSNGVEGQFANKIENISPREDAYWVKLTSNGCVYQQFVKITEAQDPIIDNILIEGTTVTVLASGATLPYQYKLDKGNYQTSNIFSNVQLGTHTIYVKGADGCSTITKDFTLINTQNVITPNNDGKNDLIDYSSLLEKLEPKFEIYDRNSMLIFKGDTANRYIWNGTDNGRTLPTSSYWYILEWNESGNPKRTQLSGWILLKNRN